MTLPSANDTVVTNVTAESQRVSVDEQATILVTVKNPQRTADTHMVELELFGEVVNSREVRVPARGKTTVRFVHNLVSPGEYTARVDSETTTITVVPSDDAAATSSSTSTQFPGFGVTSVLIAALVVAILAVRRD